MTTAFIRKDAIVAATRTLVYTCPPGVSSVLFDGQITNVDSTNKVDRYITLEIRKADAVTYRTIFKELVVPYGSASPMPKQVLAANEILYATCDLASALEIGVQILELS